jgi:pilus assembly protein Flp/PilA
VAVALLSRSVSLIAWREPSGYTHIKKEIEMNALVTRFVREDSGQDLIEYGLLVAIITTGAISAIIAIGGKVQGYFTTLNSKLP